MANAKCLNCTALFTLKFPKDSTGKIQCPKCCNKASISDCYKEYERYSKIKVEDSLKKKEEELKKKELELKKK